MSVTGEKDAFSCSWFSLSVLNTDFHNTTPSPFLFILLIAISALYSPEESEYFPEYKSIFSEGWDAVAVPF